MHSSDKNSIHSYLLNVMDFIEIEIPLSMAMLLTEDINLTDSYSLAKINMFNIEPVVSEYKDKLKDINYEELSEYVISYYKLEPLFKTMLSNITDINYLAFLYLCSIYIEDIKEQLNNTNGINTINDIKHFPIDLVFVATGIEQELATNTIKTFNSNIIKYIQPELTPQTNN